MMNVKNREVYKRVALTEDDLELVTGGNNLNNEIKKYANSDAEEKRTKKKSGTTTDTKIKNETTPQNMYT